MYLNFLRFLRLPGGYKNKEVKVISEDVQEEVSEEVDVQEDVKI